MATNRRAGTYATKTEAAIAYNIGNVWRATIGIMNRGVYWLWDNFAIQGQASGNLGKLLRELGRRLPQMRKLDVVMVQEPAIHGAAVWFTYNT